MTRLALLAALALLGAAGGPARAESLQCRSVNGNVTCAAPGGAACQRVDGRTTCVSRGGGVVQEFGGTALPKLPPAMLADIPELLRRQALQPDQWPDHRGRLRADPGGED